MTMPGSAVDLLALTAAVPFAMVGGHAFLKGIVGVAAALRLPRFLVATTLAAFATSSPELTVSTMAALSGKPEIGLGDALGSNVVNTALILGIVLLSGPVVARFGELRRDFAVAAAVPILTMVLVSDGTFSRIDGAILITIFLTWLVAVSRQALDHRRHIQLDPTAASPWVSLAYSAAGLACLVVAGYLFVSGATGIAAALDLDPYVIGATLVAIGTSMPELVSTLLSRRQGHDDVGLGVILGSNLFNGLAIVGLATSIHPATPPVGEVALTLAFGLVAVLLIVPRRGGIPAYCGPVLLACYVAYVFVTYAS